MALIKCKMCGGDLVLMPDATVAECEYCGSVQTVPVADNEKKLNLFARANRLRAACEFDKAAGIYETIVADFPEEAEAYWGLVLCKYGIEYVDDPGTGNKIPTCHRSSFESVLDDANYEQIMETADTVAYKVYRAEARQIEQLRKGIIEVSSREDPYDIFICYKETDDNGDRTLDSVLAQDIYDALQQRGYRTFFARISLEDKLGREYEPYIFAALNSAKIMLAIGTDYDYYNAVWVKNEWSRFLQLMNSDRSRYLIPCYKGIDAYDMPKEFRKLQAQDLGKVGAIQDLLRGVEKIIPKKTDVFAVSAGAMVQQTATGPSMRSMLQRIQIFLEDANWSTADEYCEKVLDIDPQNSLAYLYKLMAQLRISDQEELANCHVSLEQNNLYMRALRYADPVLAEKLKGYQTKIEAGKENAKKEEAYQTAIRNTKAGTSAGYHAAVVIFEQLNGYKDSQEWIERCKLQILQLGLAVLEEKRRQEAEKHARAMAEEEKRRRLEAEALARARAEQARREEEARRLEILGTGRVICVVKDSKNPLALANDTTYVFRIDGKTEVKVVAGKGNVGKEIRMLSGEHYVDIFVYSWQDPQLKQASYTIDRTPFRVVKNKAVYLFADRGGLFSKIGLQVENREL